MVDGRLPELGDALLRAAAAALRSQLVTVEEDLAALRLEIGVAEQRYLAVVGPVLAALQIARARLLAVLAEDDPHQQARAQQAAEEAEYFTAIVEAPQPPAVTDELRTLYRRAARELHPDLADDEASRERRHALMAAANAAMERRDEDALRHLLETATAPAAARVVTQDDIGELRHRLDRARTEAAGLRQSSGGRLAARLRDNDSYLTDVKATLEAELAEVGKALAAAT